MDKTKIFEAAGKFAAKGQLDKAAKEYQRILEEDPKDVRALQKLAEIHQKNGRSREATDLMLQVADGYTEQGFFLKAVAVYKQILKVGTDRIEVNQKLAALYQQLGLVGDATQQYQLVANYFDRNGNIKESLAALRRMVELDPDNVASQVKLGELYAREQLIPEAVGELRKAAAYLKQNNRHDDYLRVLDRIGQIAADDVPTARELAQNYLALGDTKRALAKLQICFKHNPKDIETLHLLARAFIALEQEPKAVSVYRELARVHEERGETNDYRQTLERILELSPDDPDAATALRELQSKVGAPTVLAPPPPRTTSPAPVSPAKTSSAPNQPRVRQQRPPGPNVSAAVVKMLTETDVYLKYGLVVKAAEHVKGALIEDPDCIEVHEKALLIYERQNKQDEITRELARLVELSRRIGNRDRLNEYTQELAQRDPNHPLVVAAAADADLPAVDDDVIIETDDEDGVIVVQPDDLDDGIEVSTEMTLPPPQASMNGRVGGASPAPWDRIIDDEEEAILVDGEHLDSVPPPRSHGALDLVDDASLVDAIDRATGQHSTASADAFDDDEAIVVPDDDALPPMPDFGDVETSAVEVSAAHMFLAEGGSSAELDEMPDLDAMPLDDGPPTLHTIPASAATAQTDEEDEFAEEYDEAEFLVQQGLTDDARAVLEGILVAAPDHRRSLALLRHLNGEPPQAEAAPANEAFFDGSGGFDLAGELADEFDKIDVSRATPSPESSHSVKDVLAEFKVRLSAPVSAEDSQTHYDLGIAYKEMGLYDEAIHEFEVALQGRGRMRVIDCLTMLGVCRLEKGDTQGALAHFEQALKTPGLTLEASKEAHFEIGHCQELLGDDRSALDHYARVYKADQTFRDVKLRVGRLSQKLRGAPEANGTAKHANGAVPTPARGVPATAPAKEAPENTGPRGSRGKIGYI